MSVINSRTIVIYSATSQIVNRGVIPNSAPKSQFVALLGIRYFDLFFISILSLFLVGSPCLAENSGISSVPSVPHEQPPSGSVVSRDTEAILREARQLMAAGEVEEASSRLEEALEISKQLDTVERTRDAIGKINTEILFSKRLTDSSEVYIVKPGDALAKIAKKYNTTVELIMLSNGLQNSLIRPDDHLKVSKAAYSITVDKSDRRLVLLSDGKFFKQYIVAVGKPTTETPIGTFSIDNKLKDPTWFRAGAIVPFGSPENTLGTRWLGFSIPGYGIHGTTEPETIGQDVTAGCIRMHNAEAEELYAIVPVGTWVTVTE